MKLPLSLAGAILIAGCAQIVALDCGSDSYQLGRRDGRLGALPQAEAYARSCTPGAGFDAARYIEGWREGFAERPRPPS